MVFKYPRIPTNRVASYIAKIWKSVSNIYNKIKGRGDPNIESGGQNSKSFRIPACVVEEAEDGGRTWQKHGRLTRWTVDESRREFAWCNSGEWVQVALPGGLEGPQSSLYPDSSLFCFLYLFIYGCMWSSLLCSGFLQLRRAGATLRAEHGLLIALASHIEAHQP